jgi:hypothetical protein
VYLQQPESVLQGARIKVMRCAGVGPVVPFSWTGRRAFDMGVGMNLDLNGAGLAPSVRSCQLCDRADEAAQPSDGMHIMALQAGADTCYLAVDRSAEPGRLGFLNLGATA